MDHLRRLEDRLFPDVVSAAFDGGASDQIHVSPKYPTQLVLHPDNVEQCAPRARIEADQHIDIAVGIEVIPHHGAEQSQLRNPPAFAEGGDTVGGYGNARSHKEARVEHIFRYAHIYPRVVAMLGSGKIDVTPLITDTYAFSDAIEALDYARSEPTGTVKVQIEMPGDA